MEQYYLDKLRQLRDALHSARLSVIVAEAAFNVLAANCDHTCSQGESLITKERRDPRFGQPAQIVRQCSACYRTWEEWEKEVRQ